MHEFQTHRTYIPPQKMPVAVTEFRSGKAVKKKQVIRIIAISVFALYVMGSVGNGIATRNGAFGSLFPQVSAASCPSGTFFDTSTSRCEANPGTLVCPPGSTEVTDSIIGKGCIVPATCPAGTTAVSDDPIVGKACVVAAACPSGTTEVTDSGTEVCVVPAACPSGTFTVTDSIVGEACVTFASSAPPYCPSDETYDPDHGGVCVVEEFDATCPSGETFDLNNYGGACIVEDLSQTCPSGETFNMDAYGGACLVEALSATCPSGQTFDPDHYGGSCEVATPPCPSETQYDPGVNLCDVVSTPAAVPEFPSAFSSPLTSVLLISMLLLAPLLLYRSKRLASYDFSGFQQNRT